LDWRAKVELFEQIRWEYEFGVGTIQGVSRKLGVHRLRLPCTFAAARGCRSYDTSG